MRNANHVLSDILEAYEAWGQHKSEPTVDVAGEPVPIGKAAGRFWHCRDAMPNALRRDVLHLIRLGETPRTETTLATYAQAARIVEFHRLLLVACAKGFERTHKIADAS